MTNQELAQLSAKYLFNNYGPRDVAIVRGEGARLWDADGREYLDMLSGIAVCSVGHCHPKVVAAICEQAGKLIHVSNLYNIEPQIELAKRLVELSFADKVFFCNSGTEAVEGALKLAKKHGTKTKGPECHEFIAALNSFHGRTLGSISVTGQKKYHKGFEPLLPKVRFIDFNDKVVFSNALDDKICGVILEPVQGEGGVQPACKEYLQFVREECTKNDTVLIFDEIQCGMGRTGKLFAYEHYGVAPDVMTLAKALGGGMPVGALLATDRFSEVLSPGTHASTFGGNPVIMAAALETLQLMVDEGLLERCRQLGDYFMGKLNGILDKFEQAESVRGKGLMLGLVLTGPSRPLMAKMRDKGILCAVALENVLRFLPPFVITEEDIDRTIKALEEVLSESTT